MRGTTKNQNICAKSVDKSTSRNSMEYKSNLNTAFQIGFYCSHWVSEKKYGLHCLYLAKG